MNIFRITPRVLFRMASLDRLKQNAELAKQTIEDLKTELSNLNSDYKAIMMKELREENARLTAAVEEAKARLIQLETKNGIPQIAVPNRNSSTAPETPSVAPEVPAPQPKPKKEKKSKEPAPVVAEAPVDIGRLDLRIAKVEDVQRHPDADTLYVLKINCGEEKPRTVCSGLVKHVPMEELRDRTVMLLCNLKPVKMRGITSEAMVMCASSEQGVEVLIPPASCTPGDHVHCEGYIRQPDPVMNPKKKIFETVALDLHTDSTLKACYKGVPLTVPEKGPILAKTLSDVPVK